MKRIVVYSKSDLADPQGNSILIQKPNMEPNTIMNPIVMSFQPKTKWEQKVTADSIKNILNCIQSRYPKHINYPNGFSVKLLVVGIPNVGKSTLINYLKGYGRFNNNDDMEGAEYSLSTTKYRKHLQLPKSVAVAPHAGVTKSISSFLKISNQNPKVYILDSPGIMSPDLENRSVAMKLAITGAIKDAVIGEVEIADYLLFSLNQSLNGCECLMKTFELSEPIDEIYRFLDKVIVKQGLRRLSNGEPNYLQAAQYFLSLYRKGKLGLYTFDQIY